MIPIGDKAERRRTAVAEGDIALSGPSLRAIKERSLQKGDALEAARVAALLAVKDTPHLLAHCHPIPIESCSVTFRLEERTLTVRCTVEATAKTGVEMEALTGTAVALLTVWDMVKPLEKDKEGQYPETAISNLRVIEKRKETP